MTLQKIWAIPAEHAEPSIQVVGSKVLLSFRDFCVFCGSFDFFSGLTNP